MTLPGWARDAGFVAAVVLALAGVLAGARCGRPAESVTSREATREAVTVAATTATRDAAKVITRREVTTATRAPDGATVVRVERVEVEREATREAVATATRSAERETQREETRTVARPGWAVSVAALWRPSNLSTVPAVVQLEAARRVVAGAWVGAVVQRDMSSGGIAAGVVVRVEF